MFQELTLWITENIAVFGYSAVIVLMALESANIPIPSEIILPYAGFLVSRGQLNFHLAALAGGLGCLIGSLGSYWLGKKFGREFLEHKGKWLFIGKKQLAWGDHWMAHYGNLTAFFSRLLPVVRTFISFIMGVWKAPLAYFSLLTFLGSWIWSYLLVYVGFVLGENWESLHPLWQKFDFIIVGSGLIVVVGYIIHHVRQR